MTTPFSEPSTLPYGMPPFAEIRDEHYLPAFEEGMAEHLQEVQNITRRRDMPTFENTMIPLEQSGQLLTRVANVFYNKASADSNETTRRARGGDRARAGRPPGRREARLAAVLAHQDRSMTSWTTSASTLSRATWSSATSPR